MLIFDCKLNFYNVAKMQLQPRKHDSRVLNQLISYLKSNIGAQI